MAASGTKADREQLLIGLRLKDMRAQYGYTLEQVAERLEVSASYLSNIECGRKPPSLELLVRAAKAFDISLDYLVLGRREPTQGGFLVFHTDEELLKTILWVDAICPYLTDAEIRAEKDPVFPGSDWLIAMQSTTSSSVSQ